MIQIVRRDGFDLELVDRVADVVTTSGATVQGARLADTSERFCADPFGARILLLGPGSPLRADEPAAVQIAVAHIGASVADLDASAAFCGALGFEVGGTSRIPPSFDALAELDGVAVRSRPVSLGAYRLQLLQRGPVRDAGIPVRLPLNRSGDLIHFGTGCDDFDAMLDVVTDAGGTIVERTRAQFPPKSLPMTWNGDPHGWVFVLDPNGVQIEIVGPRSASAA